MKYRNFSGFPLIINDVRYEPEGAASMSRGISGICMHDVCESETGQQIVVRPEHEEWVDKLPIDCIVPDDLKWDSAARAFIVGTLKYPDGVSVSTPQLKTVYSNPDVAAAVTAFSNWITPPHIPTAPTPFVSETIYDPSTFLEDDEDDDEPTDAEKLSDSLIDYSDAVNKATKHIEYLSDVFGVPYIKMREAKDDFVRGMNADKLAACTFDIRHVTNWFLDYNEIDPDKVDKLETK